MRFPVQYVNRPNLDFRGYAGTLASGSVKVGQRVKVLPSGVESSVARIVTFDGDLQEAHAGEAITLVLKDEIDISRGDLLLDAGEALPAVQSAAIDVVWMAEQPLSPGQSYDIKVAGKKTRARVDSVQYQVDINNVTVGAGLVREPLVQEHAAASQFSAFELELNALVRRHFPHWGARDLLGGK